jgi:hypothetical protein
MLDVGLLEAIDGAFWDLRLEDVDTGIIGISTSRELSNDGLRNDSLGSSSGSGREGGENDSQTHFQ